MLSVRLFREELRMWIEELIWLWGPTVCAIGGEQELADGFVIEFTTDVRSV